MSDVVALQNDKVRHLKYSLKMSYKSISESTVLKKKVELCFLDHRRVSPKFITLYWMFMDIKNHKTYKPIIEAIIPIPSHPGKCQIMFRDIDRNTDYISKIKRCLAVWF